MSTLQLEELEKIKLKAKAMAAAHAAKTIAIKKVYDRPKPYKWASQLALIAVITGAFSFLGAMGINKIVETVGDAAASKFESKPTFMENIGWVENTTQRKNKWVKVLISGGVICIGIAIVGTLFVQMWHQVVERNLHYDRQKSIEDLNQKKT